MRITTNPLIKALTETVIVKNPLAKSGGRTRKMRRGTRKMRKGSRKMRARKGKSRRAKC